MKSDYFPVHAHSKYSVMDGMGNVADIAKRVAELGQPGWSLTDHGIMAGVVQGYQASKKYGLAFFPGCEFYLVRDVHDPKEREKRYHLGMMALDFKGYQAMLRLQTLSYQKDRFYRKPLIDLSDLAFLKQEGLSDHIAVTTGCYSGIVIDSWGRANPPEHAHNMILMLTTWFPNLYVELQNHDITWDNGVHDIQIADHLARIAKELGLPCVMGGDSHYIYPDQQPVHDLMKDICYFGDGEDLHFNGGPYHLLSAQEAMDSMPHLWPQVEEGHSSLLDLNRMSIPSLDKYKFQVPTLRKSPDKVLRDLTYRALKAKNREYLPEIERVEYELGVIKRLGMANYFLISKEHVTDWCRAHDVLVNARGSANGSFVCYLLGITAVDSLKWNIPFDRFLSINRQKPPDIDFDLSFRARGRLIEHMRSVFPSMVQIATYAQIGFGKPDPDTGEEAGSVIVQYMAAHRKLDPNFDGKVKPEHREALDRLAETPVYKSIGTNAAGFVIPGDNFGIKDHLPLARVVSSDTIVSQYSKDDVEAVGFVKYDFLGLRALETLNGTLRLLGKPPNEWDWIPLDDPTAARLAGSGNTAGLFQYEGFTNGRGAREMKVKTTLDFILGLALYRPALINGGQKDLYLHNRKKKRANQHRLHSLFDPVLDVTAGVPIFQEQILEMLQTIGMAFQDYNDLMTSIKASNGNISNAAGTFKRVMPIFYDLCEDKGLTDDEADDAWAAVVGFTEYGFNKAHSASYGLMAYYSAYLKAHYPLEYMASLLDVWAEVKEKVKVYTAEARRMGIQLARADVNQSGASWGIDPTRKNTLRKGLVSLNGIGETVAEAIVASRPAGGFQDLADFMEKTPRSPVTGGTNWKKGGPDALVGVCKTLYESGAMNSIIN